jgi:hypothetical protein
VLALLNLSVQLSLLVKPDFSYRYGRRTHTVRSQYADSKHTVRSQYADGKHTVHSQYADGKHSVRSQCADCTLTVRTRYAHGQGKCSLPVFEYIVS